MVIYRYARHHAPYEETLTSLDIALNRAASDQENGKAFPKEIVDGDRAYQGDEL